MTKFNADDRLNGPGGAPLGYLIHEALHRRIADLADLAEEESGRRPSKKEVLSALLLAAPEDGEELNSWIASYHKARVSDALIGNSTEAKVIDLPARRAGRPPHR